LDDHNNCAPRRPAREWYPGEGIGARGSLVSTTRTPSVYREFSDVNGEDDRYTWHTAKYT